MSDQDEILVTKVDYFVPITEMREKGTIFDFHQMKANIRKKNKITLKCCLSDSVTKRAKHQNRYSLARETLARGVSRACK